MRCVLIALVTLFGSSVANAQRVKPSNFELVREIHEKLSRKQTFGVPDLINRLIVEWEPGLVPPIDDPDIERSMDCWLCRFLTEYRELEPENYRWLEPRVSSTIGKINRALNSNPEATGGSKLEWMVRILPQGETRAKLLNELGDEFASASRDKHEEAELVWLQNIYRQPSNHVPAKVRNELQIQAVVSLANMWAELGLHYDAIRLSRDFNQEPPKASVEALPNFGMPEAFEWQSVPHENPRSKPARKYDFQIVDIENGKTVYEKKQALQFIPEITFIDPEKKQVRMLCPKEDVTISLNW